MMLHAHQFVLLLLLPIQISLSIKFEDNAYKDVVVSIHPDVPDTHADEIIDGIKTLFIDGSEKLYKATRKYGYVKNVNILLPANWNYDHAEISDEYFYEDGQIRVNTENPLYRDVSDKYQNANRYYSHFRNTIVFIFLVTLHLTNGRLRINRRVYSFDSRLFDAYQWNF